MEYKAFIEAVKTMAPGTGLPNTTDRNLHIEDYPLQGTAYPCKLYCRFYVQSFMDEGTNVTHESMHRTMIVNGTAVPTNPDFSEARAKASRVRESVGKQDTNTVEEVFEDMFKFYQPFQESINLAYCKQGWTGSGHEMSADPRSYLNLVAISKALSEATAMSSAS